MKNTFKALALAAMVAVSMLASSCAFAQTEEVAHHLYQLRQHCAARGGSVVSSTQIKASFAFDVVVGEPITMGHCLLAMHNGKKVTDLHKGVNYVVIDLNRYLNFVPYDVEEIKALGRHAEVIGVGDKKGVKITGFYSRWNVPANFKVNVYDVDTGSNRQYFVDEELGARFSDQQFMCPHREHQRPVFLHPEVTPVAVAVKVVAAAMPPAPWDGCSPSRRSFWGERSINLP